jgi:hypothetical protein
MRKAGPSFARLRCLSIVAACTGGGKCVSPERNSLMIKTGQQVL